MENEKNPRTEQNGGEKKQHNNHYYNRNRKRKTNRPHQSSDQANASHINNAHVTSNENGEVRINNEQSSQVQKPRNNNKHHQRRNNRKSRPPRPVQELNENAEAVEFTDELIELETTPVPDFSEDIFTPSEDTVIENISENTEDTPESAVSSEELVEIIGVRFKVGGKTYYFSPNGITGKKGEHVIVETARGLEFGEIAVPNSMVSESEFVPPLRPVIRIATEADVKHHDENGKKQDEAFRICNEKIIAHELDMKLIDAQYTFDNTKLLFYFTSAGRVDFRELVKDLASVFKTRIELRQIGIRDEAKIIGGLGICGRPLCCSRFLSDFGQVSIKMAKEQNLSLNSSKISGACGRLMCCLRYEYDTYVQEIKNTPPVDSHVRTPDGVGVVTEIMPLAGKVKVRLDDKPDQQPKVYSRDTVTIIPKQKQ